MPRSHPPPEDDLELEGQETGTPPAVAPAPGASNLTSEHVRNTPEYRELQRQNRLLAREKGEIAAREAAARAQAEQARQAAEAATVAAQEQKVRDLLGDEGVAFWDQFSELSTTDPVKAAELLAEFRGKAQSQPPAPAAPAETAGGTQQVTGQQQQAPATGLSRTVGDAPIAGTGDDTDSVIEGLTQRYQSVVERNLDPTQRNRVTMRDRASAMIAYVGAAYLKSGAKPKS